MKTGVKSLAALALAVALLLPAVAQAAKKYQVTGKVLEVTDKVIVVQKDDERWELNRDSTTVVKGDLKVGAKVTIEYKMIAVDVTVKDDKKDSK